MSGSHALPLLRRNRGKHSEAEPNGERRHTLGVAAEYPGKTRDRLAFLLAPDCAAQDALQLGCHSASAPDVPTVGFEQRCMLGLKPRDRERLGDRPPDRSDFRAQVRWWLQLRLIGSSNNTSTSNTSPRHRSRL